MRKAADGDADALMMMMQMLAAKGVRCLHGVAKIASCGVQTDNLRLVSFQNYMEKHACARHFPRRTLVVDSSHCSFLCDPISTTSTAVDCVFITTASSVPHNEILLLAHGTNHLHHTDSIRFIFPIITS